jgi:hypothetical protein
MLNSLQTLKERSIEVLIPKYRIPSSSKPGDDFANFAIFWPAKNTKDAHKAQRSYLENPLRSLQVLASFAG